MLSDLPAFDMWNIRWKFMLEKNFSVKFGIKKSNESKSSCTLSKEGDVCNKCLGVNIEANQVITPREPSIEKWFLENWRLKSSEKYCKEGERKKKAVKF